MNDELALRYRVQLEQTLGWPGGRMIARSKSGYRESNPDHIPIFNANICIEAAKIHWCDLDLTLDEPKLVSLAEWIGERIYVLYEHDGRFENEEDPLLGRAVYTVVPTGETSFPYEYLERARDGTLRRRQRSVARRRPRFQHRGEL